MPNVIAKGPIEFNIHGPMVSASHVASLETYNLYTGKSGKKWVVATGSSPAENIYKDGGVGSQGMAGRTLTFRLTDGTSVDFIGPWRTGAGDLLADTGIDVRNTYYTKGIIALDREAIKGSYAINYSRVLYYDSEPVLGDYNRIDELAQLYANELGVKVWVGLISAGGGHAGWKDPELAKK